MTRDYRVGTDLETRFLRKGVSPMAEVSTFRLYLLRAMYAFTAVGLLLARWPAILNPPSGISNAGTVVAMFLGALSILAVLGIRYPLKMLPLLFFELLWKVMWVVGWGFPLWSTQQLAPDSEQTLISNLVGVVLVPLAIPWGYVFKQYVKAPGDRWRKPRTSSTPTQPSSSPSPATTSSRP
jgi:hypothetical protein